MPQRCVGETIPLSKIQNLACPILPESIPSGDAPRDARSDAPTSLTLRYRYRFANATAALTAVAHGGNPQTLVRLWRLPLGDDSLTLRYRPWEKTALLHQNPKSFD
ncbi:MAG: hypothetical protein V7K40_22660 [Nostoc sp.]|uniref:hypothetical protein n=1 Tax=Nostoc sp. TaxID=1180 RepID=UPI002FF56623